MSSHRRTKIVTTIGPATRSVEGMIELIEAGADVFRFNFSHGTRDDHAENVAMAREAAERSGKEVGILGDLPGPKLRIGDVEEGIVGLRPGSEIVLTTEDCVGTDERLSVSYDGLPEAVTTDGLIYLADGRIRLRVLEAGDDEVRCSVEVGGRISSHQGLNLPGAEVGLPAAGREDLAWVDFAVAHDIDLLAVSFVRRAEDLAPVERRVRTGGSDIPVIAKIEKPQAAERAEEIVKAVTAGVMIARGDLGIELPIERVPGVQRHLLALAGRYSVPSITATQMLASMVASPRPTRAEVSDVANAIFQGTDAIMLSEETAVGDYPAEAVRVMDRIARETEPELPYGDWVFNRAGSNETDVASSVARAAVGVHLHARARRDRRPDAQWPHRAAGLRTPSADAGAGDLAAAGDGQAAQPPLRRPVRDRRRLDRDHGIARRLRSARPPGRGGEVRRPDRDHRGAAPAGPGHEPLRDPPRAVGPASSALESATASRVMRPDEGRSPGERNPGLRGSS